MQTNPGDDSPLLSRTEFSDTLVGANLTWYLWNGETVRQTGNPPNFGLTVVGDYLFMVHGTPESIEAIVDNLTIQPRNESHLDRPKVRRPAASGNGLTPIPKAETHRAGIPLRLPPAAGCAPRSSGT